MENIESTEKKSCGCGCSASEKSECAETAVEKAEGCDCAAPSRQTYVPAVDIVEAGSLTELVVDLPGVAEDGVDLSVEKNILTIKAAAVVSEFEGMKPVYSEFGIGDFQRSFALSEDIDRENISASLKDGVLRVKLPKAAPSSRKITVAGN